MSSAEPAAVVENVGKCYHIYDRHLDRLRQSFVLGPRKLYRDFWALRDITFSIDRGETVGIVGANGSGKSTLLQLMFGVLQPSTGRIKMSGRVGGLLELGAGFNPEETGRENVRVNAAILGIPPADVPGLMATVEAFADIGDFLDQPIKVYSSGMAVRLGFALQISVPCDVLIVDEALAVDDELFQRKCYAALERFRDDGGTVLFVSHSAAAVKQMCRRALFLDRGRLVQVGRCKTVVDSYQKFLYMREPDRSEFAAALMAAGPVPVDDPAATIATVAETAGPVAIVDHPNATDQGVDRDPPPADFEPGLVSQTATYYQSVGATISDPRVETADGRRVNVLNPRESYRYRYRVAFDREARGVLFGWLVKSTGGLELGGGAHEPADACVRVAAAGSAYDVAFDFTVNLYPGVYFLNCGVSGSVGDAHGFLHRVIDAVAFRVRNVYTKITTGFADLDYRSAFELVAAPTSAVEPAVEPAAEPAAERVPAEAVA